MQKLKPRIDNIKERYGENSAAVQRETQLLYDEAGVNPTAGTLLHQVIATPLLRHVCIILCSIPQVNNNNIGSM